jgi:hypothetical protein
MEGGFGPPFNKAGSQRFQRFRLVERFAAADGYSVDILNAMTSTPSEDVLYGGCCVLVWIPRVL